MTTLHRLQVFALVAKYLNVTQAAQELHVSQPAVSQELKALEDDCGATLIERRHNGIALTEAGVAFRANAESIISLLNGLKPKSRPRTAEEPEHVLMVGASHGLSTSLMPMLMARFRESHPRVHLRLYTEISRQIVHLLLNSNLEIAIATNPERVAALQMEPFRSAKLCAVIRADHPLAKRKKIALHDLAQEPLIIRTGKEGGSRTALLLSKMRKIGLSPSIPFGCGSRDAVKAAVRDGCGVGILVEDPLRQRDLGRIGLKTLEIADVNLAAQSYILYAKKKPLSKAANNFLILLRQLANKQSQSRAQGTESP